MKLNKFHHKWKEKTKTTAVCVYCSMVRYYDGKNTYYTRPGEPVVFQGAGACPSNPLLTQQRLEL